MVLVSFGGKTAEQYIPGMKELILSGEKCQTGRLCRCELDDYLNGNPPVENRRDAEARVCYWHRLKVGDLLHLYMHPRQKKQWELCDSIIEDRKFVVEPLHMKKETIEGYKKTTYTTTHGTFQELVKLPETSIEWYRQVGGCEFLGIGEVTEIIEVRMVNDAIMPIVGNYGLSKKHGTGWIGASNKFAEDLAFRNSFKSVEDMFKFFDKVYGLSEPKEFVFIRWRLL